MRAATILQVLFEDNHCLAVLKPAGVLTMGDRTGDVSMVELAREYLRQKYRKPGNVFVGVVHRLDRPVSGVLLLARTSKAAARLSEQFRKHSVRKVYQAVVEGRPQQQQGEFVDWLAKDEAGNVSRVVGQETGGRGQEAGVRSRRERATLGQETEIRSRHEQATFGQGTEDTGHRGTEGKQARLTYRCVRTGPGVSLLEIDLRTGRSHQIRVQCAARGMPICGDVKYGSKTRLDGWLALHAAALIFDHPTRGEAITVTAPAPSSWKRFRWKPRPDRS
jgi:23S rRNA pseudouridine1911/1915/1917 synthase